MGFFSALLVAGVCTICIPACIQLLSGEESQTKAILYFYLMVFQCAGKSVKESKLSMNGINANTKCIYECLHKVCSSYGTSIKLMDLL